MSTPGDRGVTRRAPVWVRIAGAAIRRLPFGRYRAAHALGRFRGRPFIATLRPDLGGLRFHCDLGDAIAREACFTGWYEPQETQLAASLVRHGDVVADLGANWGYFTLAAAYWTAPSGQVLAFEPDPRMFAILQTNLAMNSLRHVVLQQKAVGATSGEAAFLGYENDSDNRGVSRLAGSAERADFVTPIVSLDDALDGLGVGTVRLVKMDVEGGEGEALLGMSAGLRRRRYEYVLLEVHPGLLQSRSSSPAAAVRPLIEAGYALWSIDHSPAMYRRAAREVIPRAEMLRPFDASAALDAWPHLIAVSPDASL